MIIITDVPAKFLKFYSYSCSKPEAYNLRRSGKRGVDLGSRRPKEMLQSFKFVWGHWNPINIALQFEWRVEAGRQMLYLAGANTDRSTWNETAT